MSPTFRCRFLLVTRRGRTCSSRNVAWGNLSASPSSDKAHNVTGEHIHTAFPELPTDQSSYKPWAWSSDGWQFAVGFGRQPALVPGAQGSGSGPAHLPLGCPLLGAWSPLSLTDKLSPGNTGILTPFGSRRCTVLCGSLISSKAAWLWDN